MTKHIAILGSTGSIGTQTLDVARANADKLTIEVLTAGHNADLLIKQAREFKPNAVVIADETKYEQVKQALADLDVKVWTDAKAIEDAAQMSSVDTVVTAMVGYVGLSSTIKAIEAGKNIALSNKETLVVAGELITNLVAKHKVRVTPVDSEHSAIFQCLVGEPDVEKLIITASGGPFRTKSIDELRTVTPQQALKHPNWNMGAKITIDSATMMNKGLEVIEAHWLFGIPYEQIEVTVHPQSIIHSMVQFVDGSVKAQMGLPDMRLPIQYALSYPDRWPSTFGRIDFKNQQPLTFEAPNIEKFRCLALAYEALGKGGNMPAIMNAANEVAVAAFLKERIGFLDIANVVERTMHTVSFIEKPTYDDYVATDKEARRVAEGLV